MTKQEAVNQLKSLIKDTESHLGEDDEIFRDDIKALQMGIEVLEKQMPKSVRHYKSPIKVKALDSESNKVWTYECAPCPVCSKWIVVNINHKYCEYCGQALKWGEEVGT